MKKFAAWLLSPVVLGTLALIGLSALVWWVGPLIAFGQEPVRRPLDGVGMRALVLGVLWLLWIGRIAWGVLQRRRAHAALVQGLSAGPSASQKEAAVLAQRFEEATARLKAARGRSLTARLGGGSYLYELPWYVFVGAPGSGKTTALLNAGLQFLLGDDKGGGADARKASVKGVGGTRNCDWWFTQDAVLIDTAGRYTTQESDRDVDAAAWDRFLELLKRTRPRQPINGVLLTVNVQDLLQQGATERTQHAAQLRARVQELYTKLGVRAPIYVLVTKADLIGGFNESFEALDADGRAQVWGFTFDDLDARPGGDPLEGFAERYGELQRRLVEQLVGRLEAERDVLRRSAIFAFPQEFAHLQRVLHDFLRQVFSEGGSLEAAPRVRGVYFTSGTQEGSPIDRVMGALARSFAMDGRGGAVPGGRGKSFFLARLLRDVVFAERGLGGVDPVAERRRRALRWSAMGAMAVAAVAVIVGWAVSRARNLDHAAQVQARVPALVQAIDSLPPPNNADVAALPLPLAQVRDAARLEGLDLDDPPLLHGLGLYQGDKLDAGAQIAYHRLLTKTLMPRVARRLEERLRAANRDNLENAYEALKAYVMLHSPDRFEAEALQAWIGADWDANYPRMPAEQRAELDRHLAELLKLGPPRASVQRDDALVASAREMLAAFPLEVRAYGRLKRTWRPGTVPDFTAAGVMGASGPQVFERASAEPLTRGISGLFTKDGYRRFVLPTITKTLPALAAEESWVLGLRSDPARLRDATLGNAVADKVRRLYFEDYIKAWDAYIADVRMIRPTDLERALASTRLLASVDSPLGGWIRGIAEQTKLVQAPAAPANPLEKAAADARANAARLAGAAPVADAGAGPLEKMVDDHFAKYHRMVAGDPPPLRETLALFGEVNAQLMAVDAAKKSKSPPPAGGGAEKVKIAAAQQPDAVRAMLDQVADVAINQGRGAEISGLAAELKPVAEVCNRTITGRYPFASGSKADVLPEDFGQMFGQGGLLDDFFQRRLASLVDVSTATWTYRPLADGSRPVSPAALADFQRAQRIREVFFRSGGKQPALRIGLRLVEMEPGLKEVVLDIDGQKTTLVTGAPMATIAWPAPSLSPVVSVFSGLSPAQPHVQQQGPWALFRLFELFPMQPGNVPERFYVRLRLDGRQATLEVQSTSAFNPFQLREIKQFRCPASL